MNAEDLEGPGWYQDFLDTCARIPDSDPWCAPARRHAASLPYGTLYITSLQVATEVELTIRDLRTNERDYNLRVLSGSWRANFGKQPWFTIFSKPLAIAPLPGRDEDLELVAMAFTPPNDIMFVNPAGDTSFVVWDKGVPTSEVVMNKPGYEAVAPWFMAATIYRSCWQAGAFIFEDVTDPADMPDWPLPAGGYKLVFRSEEMSIARDGQNRLEGW